MKLFTEEDLIAAGYNPGLKMTALLAKAAEYEERGISDQKYALKLLKRDVGPPPVKAVMRDKPGPLAEAISTETKEEKANVAAARRQMQELLCVPVIERGVILPDTCPSGPGKAVIPVGGAIAVDNAIIPSAHSSDICCSMFATFYEERSSVAKELDALTQATRLGPDHRHLDDVVYDPVIDENVWLNRFLSGLKDRARVYMADQGDGNHFAYIGEMTVTPEILAMLRLAGHGDLAGQLAGPETPAPDEAQRVLRVLVTHHGSRSLGAHVYKRGQIAAEKHVRRIGNHIPEAGAWLDASSESGKDYWHALQYVARWTEANHRAIHRRFLENIGAEAVAEVKNQHNFVWQRGDTFYHGKGATPAWRDDQGRPQLGLIPLNMAEPVLLVLGADQDEFLSFAPHGAGRNLSRTAMRKQYRDASSRRAAIEHSTREIDVRWYCGKADLTETPLAYKNADAVKQQIREFGLAEIVAEIRPLGCIMAGDSGRSWRNKEEELTPKQKRQIEHRADRRRVRQGLMHDDSDED